MQTPWKRPWQRRWTYALVGLLAAQALPIGLLLGTRLAMRQWPSWTYAVNEVASLGIVYHYLGVSATILLIIVGYLLGARTDQLREAAGIDLQTGLGSARRFGDELHREEARATRYGTPLALLLVDIDNLSLINEAWGRPAGDEALRQVARCLRDTCRSTDTLCHRSEDEFAVILPGSGTDAARRVAERLKDALAKQGGREPGQRPLTVSIGIAEIETACGRTADDLLAMASQMLGRAKAEGRDRICEAPAIGVPLFGTHLPPEQQLAAALRPAHLRPS